MHHFDEETEPQEDLGSDELLSDDNLRLPDHASMLVRLHAVRSWLTRRQAETMIDIGEAALTLQEAQHEEPGAHRLRRREQLAQDEQVHLIQHTLIDAQQRQQAYEEAQALLEDCIAHTTSGERVLVEFYLMLEEMIGTNAHQSAPWLRAIADVQSRVERVGAPNED